MISEESAEGVKPLLLAILPGVSTVYSERFVCVHTGMSVRVFLWGWLPVLSRGVLYALV